MAADIFLSASRTVVAYCDNEEKEYNPFSLQYLGPDNNLFVIQSLREYDYFISVGDNTIRHKIYERLLPELKEPVNAVHPTAVVSASVKISHGVFIAASATINPLVRSGNGVIFNTSCSIDHECVIGDFAHIGPGAVLCGNVRVGNRSFIGAGAIIRQGVNIGNDVIVGAGAVVVKDVSDNVTMIGNPSKELNKK